MPTGKILAANDEWILSDTAYNRPETQASTVQFLRNVALWFTGGLNGRFLVYTRDNVAIGSWMAQELQSLGHEVVPMDGFQGPFDLAHLAPFQAIFLVEQAADNQVLIDYVNGGGCVYVAGGGGLGANVAATRWNTFLSRFDISFADTTNGDAGDFVPEGHDIFNGVDVLYQNNGNSLSVTHGSRVSVPGRAGFVSGGTLAGAFAFTDLDRYGIRDGAGLDIASILMDHRLETDDSSALKLQLYNGTTQIAFNPKATLSIQGPYQKSGSPSDGADAPAATGITASPSVVDLGSEAPPMDWSRVGTTTLETSDADPGEYMVNLTVEYEFGRQMQETHMVQFRVQRD